MDLREIQRIGTPVVRDVVIAYHQQYHLPPEEDVRRCICGPEYGIYPHNQMEDGTPLVCPAHAWIERRDFLQKELELCGLSMPVPVMGDKYVASESGKAQAFAHPLHAKPVVRRVKIKASDGPAKTANEIVRWLHGPGLGRMNYRQHVVAYLHRSQVSNLLFSRQEQELQHVVLYMPILVYWHNHDRRNMSEWAEALIDLRQYGLAIVVKGAI